MFVRLCECVCVCQFGEGIKACSLAGGVAIAIQPLIKAHLQRRSERNNKEKKKKPFSEVI